MVVYLFSLLKMNMRELNKDNDDNNSVCVEGCYVCWLTHLLCCRPTLALVVLAASLFAFIELVAEGIEVGRRQAPLLSLRF